MTQAMIFGAAAIAAAVGTVLVIRHVRKEKKQKHSPVMTFKELYEDNAAAEIILID